MTNARWGCSASPPGVVVRGPQQIAPAYCSNEHHRAGPAKAVGSAETCFQCGKLVLDPFSAGKRLFELLDLRVGRVESRVGSAARRQLGCCGWRLARRRAAAAWDHCRGFPRTRGLLLAGHFQVGLRHRTGFCREPGSGIHNGCFDGRMGAACDPSDAADRAGFVGPSTLDEPVLTAGAGVDDRSGLPPPRVSTSTMPPGRPLSVARGLPQDARQSSRIIAS
jgi:hypothetical protein